MARAPPPARGARALPRSRIISTRGVVCRLFGVPGDIRNSFDLYLRSLGQRGDLFSGASGGILFEIRAINFVYGLKISQISEENGRLDDVDRKSTPRLLKRLRCCPTLAAFASRYRRKQFGRTWGRAEFDRRKRGSFRCAPLASKGRIAPGASFVEMIFFMCAIVTANPMRTMNGTDKLNVER